MCKVTYFVQACPTCGRKLQVKVEYLGLEVACQHCGANFVSSDPAMQSTAVVNPIDEVLSRADAFLGRGYPSLAASLRHTD